MTDSDPAARRHFHRVAFEDDASLEMGGRSLSGRIHDVSLKGVMIELDTPDHGATIGEQGHLSFPLSPEISVQMDVSVANIKGRCLGLHCDVIDLESMQHLRRIVELNLGDPELLHRDLAAMLEDSA
ncbi:MAG: PilZ domain-containing protein [Chromatiales bacterium]|nr:PilZ domain-containing protein [Chromatiales bacterium]